MGSVVPGQLSSGVLRLQLRLLSRHALGGPDRRRLTLPSGAMLAKRHASRGTLDPACAAARAVEPSVRLRSMDCSTRGNSNNNTTLDENTLMSGLEVLPA